MRRPSDDKSMRIGRTARALAAALAALAVCAPAASAGVPAVDEYTLRPPDAGGKNLGPKAPNPRLDELPASTQEAIEASPDAGTLAQVATARELGAPEKLAGKGSVPGAAAAGGAGTAETGAGGAALSALTEPAALGILAALAGIVAFAGLRRRSLTG